MAAAGAADAQPRLCHTRAGPLRSCQPPMSTLPACPPPCPCPPRSVEMSVTAEYQVRPPMRPTHFFLIDVSQPAVASGATAAVCSSVARILDDLPGGDRTQVGGMGRCGAAGQRPGAHAECCGVVCVLPGVRCLCRSIPSYPAAPSLPRPSPAPCCTRPPAPRSAWPPLTPPSTFTRCAPARARPTCWWCPTSTTSTAPCPAPSSCRCESRGSW